VATKEPERELISRAFPYAVPAAIVAGILGLVGGPGTALSAVIGILLVAGNFLAHGLSLAWAARISPTVLFAVGLGGFVVRLAVVLAAMFALNALPWFSPVAFAASVIPCTVALLVFEMRQLSGSLQADLWSMGRPS
jgi:ATP synthase protein I